MLDKAKFFTILDITIKETEKQFLCLFIAFYFLDSNSHAQERRNKQVRHAPTRLGKRRMCYRRGMSAQTIAEQITVPGADIRSETGGRLSLCATHLCVEGIFGTMIRIQRQAKVLQLLREREFVESSELARIFHVTQATIRRDLKTLAEQGVISLDHGGAALANNGRIYDEPLYETKVFVNREAKQAIGAAAAALVRSGEAIILDSGTTNAAIARSLRAAHIKGVTVITCDIMVAKELGAEQHIDVIVLGGLLRKSYYSTYGAYTEVILRNLHADKFFLGIDGADIEHGVTNIVLEEVPIKRLQMEISDQVILTADAGKFGKTALHRVCGWDAIDQVITDNCLTQDYLSFFAERNIPVLQVNPCSEPT